MAITLDRAGIAQLYVATFNRAADAEGLDYWVNDSGFDNVEDIASSFFDSPEAQAVYGDGEVNADMIIKMYDNIFNRTVDANDAGVQYWVNSGIDANKMVVALVNGALGADKDTIENKGAVSLFFADADVTADLTVPQAYSVMQDVTSDDATADAAIEAIKAAANIVDPVVPDESQTMTLTTGTDDLTGGDADDAFVSNLGQNSFTGGVSNTLSSADTLDGGAGNDTLSAVVVPQFIGADNANGESIDIQASTTSIETVIIQNESDTNQVTVDAKDMIDVDVIGSSFSDGDLVIENLTTLASDSDARDTENLTIVMDHTDNFNSDSDASDLSVYLDEDYLLTGSDTSGAALTVRLINAIQNESGNNSVEGFSSITFTVGATEVTVDITSAATDNTLDYTTVYDEIVNLINAQLIADGFTTVTASLATIENAVFSIPVAGFTTGDAAGQYYPITITNTGEEALAGVDIGTSALSYDTDLNNSFNATGPITANNPLQIDVNLEKVGREGEGGNLLVGGKSQDSGEGEGIPIFNITVFGGEDKPSNLGQITSTNDDLTTVNVASETRTDGSYASLTVRGESTTMNVGATPFGGTLDTFNANAFMGDLTIGNETAALNIDTFTATGGGDVWLSALNDTSANSVTTGSGADTLNITDNGTLTVDSGNGADDLNITVGSGTNTINAGGGDDDLDIDGTSATVDMGAGDDVVQSNDVALNVSGGTGDDVIYVENTGDKAQFTYATSGLVESVAAVAGALDGVANPVEFFQGVRVQVTLAVDENAADEGVNGYESQLISIDAASGNLTTYADINNAIVEAINEDDVLQHIAVATIVGDDVQIDYLVDGLVNTNAVEIVFFDPAVALSGTSLETAIETEWESTYNDSDEFDPLGENNTADAEQALAIAAANGITPAATVTAGTPAQAATAATITLDLAGLDLSDGDTFTITTAGVVGTYTYTADSNETTESVIADLVAAGNIAIGAESYDVTATGTTITLTNDTPALTLVTTATMAVTDTDDQTAVYNDGVALTYDGIAFAFTSAGTDPVGAGAAGEDLGADTNTGVANTVNGNAGNDVIVLSSDTGVTDTVVMTGYAQGNDTIVHFETTVDVLDLSAYLDNTISDSGSSESAVDMAQINAGADTGTTLEANSVSVVQFNGTFGADLDTAADTIEFDDLTAAELEAAMELVGNGFTTTNVANLFETTAKSIVIVHNDEQDTAADTALGLDTDNDGEYKIFEVTYDNANAVAGATNFTVTLIGQVDISDDADGSLGLVAADVIA